MSEIPELPGAQPVYNIKAVANLTGILPVTIRAWERRYGLPSPHRADQGYRLYTDRDVRELVWLKEKCSAGMSIGRAVDYLAELRHTGHDPIFEPEPDQDRPPSPGELCSQLSAALRAFDEPGANEVARRAFAFYKLDQVLTEVIQPVLIEMGESWRRGDLPIAVEHFATQFCLQHLMGMLSASVSPWHAGVIAAACAPGEQHEIGILMLVVMLRWHGWNVIYFGPNLALERLPEALKDLSPRLLLISATRPEAAANLSNLAEILSHFSTPPRVLVGGQAAAAVAGGAGFYFAAAGARPSEIVTQVENLLLAAA
jgi:DNA-binding transcriptional MerR regulator